MQPLFLLALNLQLTLLVHDFVPLRQDLRQDTSERLARILREASVDLNWIDCRAGSRLMDTLRCREPQRGDILLRFLVRGDAKAGALHLEALGFTEPNWGGRGLISLWPARIDEMRRGLRWQFDELLAYTIAHEIGHILGLDHQASAGLMASVWTRSYFRLAAPRTLAFSAFDIAVIQENLRRRLTPRQTAGEASLPGQ